MTSLRKFNQTSTISPVLGELGWVRVIQMVTKVNKDGSDSKRPAWPTGVELLTHKDGSYRFYKQGLLQRANVSNTLIEAERKNEDGHFYELH